ncbi:DNA-binding protein [Cupriavidus pauculus]|uniref:DNA-binding protein n=1 Tax=Cupriavidus pauculus TaxID=82633 RepID=UPI00385771BD
MARKGITYDQVANAAAAIKARGQAPTISAIRVELGNEGSYSTISQHLARWKADDADKVDMAALPPEVEDAAMVAITTVWNIAHKHAMQEVQAIRQEAADEKKRLEEELAEARSEIAHLEETMSKIDKQLHEEAARADQAEKKLAGVSGELDSTKQLYAALLDSIKPQASSPGKKAADTKSARPSVTAPAPEKTPGDSQHSA